MRIPQRPSALLLVLALAATAACSGDSGGSGPDTSLSRVVGTWSNVSVTAVALTGGQSDLIDDSGGLQLVIESDGDYRVRIGGDLIDIGSVEMIGDSLRFDSAYDGGIEGSNTFSMSWAIEDDELYLGQREVYDFTDDDVDDAVPATILLRFVRD